MYAADVITMTDLKEKILYINKEIIELTEILEQANNLKKADSEQISIFINEIEKFLMLDNVTNGDLRKIINRIIVNNNGEIKIYIRNFSDFIKS